VQRRGFEPFKFHQIVSGGEMKDRNQISALLGVSIIPQIIAEINDGYDNEEDAIKGFYQSELFDKIQNPATGLWHLSSKSLAQMFMDEKRGVQIEFPEEQS
jgi:hypothetical protein